METQIVEDGVLAADFHQFGFDRFQVIQISDHIVQDCSYDFRVRLAHDINVETLIADVYRPKHFPHVRILEDYPLKYVTAQNYGTFRSVDL